LVAAGAAALVPDDELDTDRLERELLQALPRSELMGDAARALGRPDAAAAVADLVVRSARPVP
jgi:UDP-N-acetylglucosamine:LPS N-acetylglucosamine transferase